MRFTTYLSKESPASSPKTNHGSRISQVEAKHPDEHGTGPEHSVSGRPYEPGQQPVLPVVDTLQVEEVGGAGDKEPGPKREAAKSTLDRQALPPMYFIAKLSLSSQSSSSWGLVQSTPSRGIKLQWETTFDRR